MTTLRVVAKRLVTCPTDPKDGLGVRHDAIVDVDGSAIERVIPAGLAPPFTGRTVQADLVTPGLCDAHTHAAWAGSRHSEYVMRMAGADYEEIAKAGGGIVESMRAVKRVTLEELTDVIAKRVLRMASLGVTTVEVKSGYGLDFEGELKQLLAIERAHRMVGPVTIVPTFLALHALPPEAQGDRSAYAARVAGETYNALRDRGLFRFVDAYLDRGAFLPEHADALCRRAKEDDVGVRLHVGQFADVGGAAFAARVGAASIDHAEHIDDADLDKLAAAGVRATLLPVASFTLRGPSPNIEGMRRAGVRMVVASDANPGTAPTESLPLALAMGIRAYGLTVSEALRGATVEAAASLCLPDRGRIQEGCRADLACWDLAHEDALSQPFGAKKTTYVIAGGEVLS